MSILDKLVENIGKLASTQQAEHGIISTVLSHVRAEGEQLVAVNANVVKLQTQITELNVKLDAAGQNAVDPALVNTLVQQTGGLVDANQADEDSLAGLFPPDAPPVITPPPPTPDPTPTTNPGDGSTTSPGDGSTGG